MILPELSSGSIAREGSGRTEIAHVLRHDGLLFCVVEAVRGLGGGWQEKEKGALRAAFLIIRLRKNCFHQMMTFQIHSLIPKNLILQSDGNLNYAYLPKNIHVVNYQKVETQKYIFS